MDLVLQPGALTHQQGAPRDLAAQHVRGLIRHPHRRQEVRGQQLGQDRSIDLVGLHLRLGDRAGLARVRHHHPPRRLSQQRGDRERVPRRLQRHLIAGPETVGEHPQRLRRSRDLALLPDQAVLPHRDLSELPMHVQPETPSSHLASPSHSIRSDDERSTAIVGITTPTDSRSQRSRASRRGGQLLTRAPSPACRTACPPRVLPVPLSRTVAPYSPPATSLQADRPVPRDPGGTTAFHTGYNASTTASNRSTAGSGRHLAGAVTSPASKPP